MQFYHNFRIYFHNTLTATHKRPQNMNCSSFGAVHKNIIFRKQIWFSNYGHVSLSQRTPVSSQNSCQEQQNSLQLQLQGMRCFWPPLEPVLTQVINIKLKIKSNLKIKIKIKPVFAMIIFLCEKIEQFPFATPKSENSKLNFITS